MSIIQYLKETRSELNHVAWPTRVQTMVFTSLVIGISIAISLYLGIFDYLFTTALSKGIEFLPAQESTIQLNPEDINLTTEPIESTTPVSE